MKESDIRPPDLFNRFLDLSQTDVQRFFPDTSVFQEISCPGCGHDSSDFAMEKLGFRYVTCTRCGSLFLNPRPSRAMIHEYYRDSEAVKFWNSHFYKETVDARREKIFKPRALFIDDLVRFSQEQCSQVLVDVGSGYGIFLEEVMKLNRFSEVLGIEPATEMAAASRDRGFRIVEKPIEMVEPEEVSATVATAFEVLEHVFSPLEFLKRMGLLLRPGGIVVLTTLTVSGFDIQVLWENSKSVHPPAHLNLLSVRGLESLVRRVGFDLIELSTPGQLDVDIVRNAIMENSSLRCERFVRQMLFDAPSPVRDAFQQFLQTHRLSSHVRVVARTET